MMVSTTNGPPPSSMATTTATSVRTHHAALPPPHPSHPQQQHQQQLQQQQYRTNMALLQQQQQQQRQQLQHQQPQPQPQPHFMSGMEMEPTANAAAAFHYGSNNNNNNSNSVAATAIPQQQQQGSHFLPSHQLQPSSSSSYQLQQQQQPQPQQQQQHQPQLLSSHQQQLLHRHLQQQRHQLQQQQQQQRQQQAIRMQQQQQQQQQQRPATRMPPSHSAASASSSSSVSSPHIQQQNHFQHQQQQQQSQHQQSPHHTQLHRLNQPNAVSSSPSAALHPRGAINAAPSSAASTSSLASFSSSVPSFSAVSSSVIVIEDSSTGKKGIGQHTTTTSPTVAFSSSSTSPNGAASSADGTVQQQQQQDSNYSAVVRSHRPFLTFLQKWRMVCGGPNPSSPHLSSRTPSPSLSPPPSSSTNSTTSQQQIRWLIFLNDPKISEDENSLLFNVPEEGVHVYDEAVSLSLDVPQEYVLTPPFDVGVLAAFNGRKVSVHTHTIWGKHGPYWTDSTGRIKLEMEELPLHYSQQLLHSTATHRLRRVIAQVHGERVLEELQIVPKPIPTRRLDNVEHGYALKDYALFVTLRHTRNMRPLYQCRIVRQRIASIDSPYQNTVVFEIPKCRGYSPFGSFSVTQEGPGMEDWGEGFLPHNIPIILEHTSSKFTQTSSSPSSQQTQKQLFDGGHNGLKPQQLSSVHNNTSSSEKMTITIDNEEDEMQQQNEQTESEQEGHDLPLIVDVMLYDQLSRVMWNRSGYLYPKHHPIFPHRWEGSLLCEDGYWGTMAFETRQREGVTRLLSGAFMVPLARINSWSKTRYKLHDVAMSIIDMALEEERLL